MGVADHRDVAEPAAMGEVAGGAADCDAHHALLAAVALGQVAEIVERRQRGRRVEAVRRLVGEGLGGGARGLQRCHPRCRRV